MQVEKNIRFLQQPQPFLHFFRTHAVHVVADIGIVYHLPRAACDCRKKPKEFHRVNHPAELADIPLNIGCNIAGVKEIALCDSTAGQGRHGTLKDTLKHLRCFRWPAVLHALLKRVHGKGQRLAEPIAIEF